jgi:UDP-N-acetylenolpyruvoylglucosamine reductase
MRHGYSRSIEPLSGLTTFGIGGEATVVTVPCDSSSVAGAIADVEGSMFVLGGGSNVLAADSGYEALCSPSSARDYLPVPVAATWRSTPMCCWTI